MRNLLRFLIRYHAVFLFVLLETLSLLMVVNYNNFHRVRFMNSSNAISGRLFEGVASITEFFNLKVVNRELAEENARLRKLLQKNNQPLFTISETPEDSTTAVQMVYIPGKVINNSVDRRYNYLTINKGYIDGVEPDMGVISAKGVVGVITNVSKHYSTAISLLNNRWNISTKIKRNDYFGRLNWDGQDYLKAKLNEIPRHVDIQKGDTIVSSGFSSIFPEGYMVGTISDFELKGGSNFYTITVDLSVDFKNLVYIEIVKNTTRKEQTELEELIQND